MNPVPALQPARESALLTRVQIDWPTVLAQRPAVLEHSACPCYLLLPEIHQLLSYARHGNTWLMLSTLWHTGARVSEMLALTPASFKLELAQPYCTIETLKKRGRPRKKLSRGRPRRAVPISDAGYREQLQRYITTQQVGKHQRLFPVTRSAVNKRIDRLVQQLPEAPRVPVSPHTFRHSFAVNAILYRIPLPAVQGWLGHTSIKTTQVYTNVLTLDTYHLMEQVEF